MEREKKDIICTLHDPTGQVPKKLKQKQKKEPTTRKLQDTWSTQNILIFLFSSNEKSKNKIKKPIPFIIVSERIWG